MQRPPTPSELPAREGPATLSELLAEGPVELSREADPDSLGAQTPLGPPEPAPTEGAPGEIPAESPHEDKRTEALRDQLARIPLTATAPRAEISQGAPVPTDPNTTATPAHQQSQGQPSGQGRSQRPRGEAFDASHRLWPIQEGEGAESDSDDVPATQDYEDFTGTPTSRASTSVVFAIYGAPNTQPTAESTQERSTPSLTH